MTSMTPTVAAIGQLHFEGNIIPHTWYQHITFDNGKVDLAAIVILADLVYWYRPTVERSETTGQVTEMRKKFADDMLQRTYQSYADQFGLTKRQCQEAIARLVAANYVRRELRTVPLANGMVMGNVLFLEPVVESIQAITYQLRKGKSATSVTPLTLVDPSEDDPTLVDEAVAVPVTATPSHTGEAVALPTERDPSHVSMYEGAHRNGRGMAPKRETYTESSTKSSSKTSMKRRDASPLATHAAKPPTSPPSGKASIHPSSFSESSLKVSVSETATNTDQTARTLSSPSSDAPPSSPHVVAYADLLGRPLSRQHEAMIFDKAPPLADWLVALRVWQRAEHNPLNVAGILELAADPKRARWKLGQLEKGDDAPKSYQPVILEPVAVDVDEATVLPFVPDVPPWVDVTWPVQDDPLTTIWRNCRGELRHFGQLKDSTLLAAPDLDGIPVYVVQVSNEQDAKWLEVQAAHRIKAALKAQIEGDFILEIAA